ncbi:hypothetical protein GGS21DRAFT_489552 [Xylaria nigripes]|nr:hypothetical protein GGS21DRAFT_489552 [Xylaria nigripes]
MAGIFPRNRSKALSSKYVTLEDTGIPRTPAHLEAVRQEKTPDFVLPLANEKIGTLSCGQALLQSCKKLAGADFTFNKPSHILFTRKASKALDQSAAKIAELQAQIDYLEAKVSTTTTNVRQRVRIPPGERFVLMADMWEAKMKLRSRVVYRDEGADCAGPSNL